MTRILALTILLFAMLVSTASAFEVGIQDQGADPVTLTLTANQLGAKTIRVIATTQNPQTGLVSAYHDAHYKVQAAILVKKTTTAGDIRGVIKAWHGDVSTVSIGNEPELNGVPACTYARLFARASAMIRREFPGMTIGFGEFSPAGSFEYIQKIARCHVRIRAAFTGVHAYQFFSDPLSAPTEKSGVGSWLGLGSLGRFRRGLAHLRLPSRLRVTEFSYLISGPYRIPMSRAASYWPRAIKQARRHADQLIIYGLGEVHDNSTWGSASLLDRFGNSTPALRALARALGRVWHDPAATPEPPGSLITDLPDGNAKRDAPLVGIDPPKPTQVASGASEDAPIPVVDEPATPVDDAPVPPPVADGSAAIPDGPVVAEPEAPAEEATP